MRNIWCVLILSIAGILQAQDELPTGKIEVVKDFEVRLTETKKIRIVPLPVPVDSNVRHYDYQLIAPSPSIEYLTPEIKPLAINPERKPTCYPFYVKAGYGSPNAFQGKISYDHVQNESFNWGLDLRHWNANNKKIPLQKFSETQGRIDGTYMLNENVQLDGYIDGQVEKVYFYGADPIPSNPESLKRVFNRYDARFELSKAYAPETSFRYKAIMQYMTDSDDLGSREKALRIGGEAGSSLGSSAFPLGIKILADLSTLKHSEDHTLNNLLIEPYFKWHSGALAVNLGATVLLNKDNNEILPEIDLTYTPSTSGFSLLAGWTGAVVKNNFQFLSNYNPYITTRLDEVNNMVSRRLYAGLKGGSGLLSYQLTADYTRFSNMAFFLQDEDEEEQFVPVYDNGNYIGLEGSIRYEVIRHVVVRASVFQRFYNPAHEDKPWHRPSLGVNGQVTYAGDDDQFHFSLLFNGENGLPYRTPGGTSLTLDPLIDLAIHGDYYFTPSLGAFFELNNVLGNKRERWVNYPGFGFNANVGVLWRLP